MYALLGTIYPGSVQFATKRLQRYYNCATKQLHSVTDILNLQSRCTVPAYIDVYFYYTLIQQVGSQDVWVSVTSCTKPNLGI